MNLTKHLRKALLENNSLAKAENPESYAKLAQTGFILAHPVKIKGQDKRPDNDIPYHSTIKFFDKEGDNEKDAHEAASKLDHQHIDPQKVGISTKVLKDRNGNDVYAVGLHGEHADKLKEHHEKFGHMGHKENYKWGAHISIPKSVHDEIKSKGHKTAHEAGIEFGPAELRRGSKTLQTYHPKMKKSEEIEDIKPPSNLDLNKGNKDVSEKSLSDIQRDTAWTWASRAAACYEKLAKTGDWKWKTDAEEYRHEAVEHAALIGDTHPHVLEEIHKSLEKYRKASESKAEDMKKSEDAENVSESDPLQNDEDAHALLNRKEEKYFLPRQFFERVTSELSDRFALGDIDTDTRYCKNRTIYLDNKDLVSLREVISKELPRMKVRIRQYSPNNQGWEQVAYAEFKIKEEDGQTKKIRVRIPDTSIDELAEGGQIVFDEFLVNINRDIDRRMLESRVRAINNAIKRKGLTKQLEVQYERRAYTGKNLRVTIDDNLQFLDARSVDPLVKESIDKEERWTKFIKPYVLAAWENPIIMEVKSDKEVPSWLRRLLKEVQVEEVSFSKYAAAMVTHLKTDKSEGEVLNVFQGSLEEMGKAEESEAPPLTKPYSSEAQRRWAHTAAGKKALGGEAGVHEWDEATKGKKLPEKVSKTEDLEKGEKVDIAVVVLRDGKFILAGKRRRNKKWGLPGGRNEKDGESNKAAAIRELEEEAGIKLSPKDLTLAGIREIKAGGEKKRIHVYTAQFPGGQPTTKNDPDEEFTAWRWIRCEDGQLPDEILDSKMTPPAEAAFDELDMFKNESLEKGAVKNALTAGAMLGALASPTTTGAKVPSHEPLIPQAAQQHEGYDRQKMLNAISMVESSGGKNVKHKPTSMGTAWGRFAEMPDVIHDTIRLNPDLKRKHGKALRLQGENLNRYMQDNKGLEDLIAQKHLERLEHHFGNDPEKIAFAYNHGIIGTNRALKAKQNISEHPYVQKFRQYYKEGK